MADKCRDYIETPLRIHTRNLFSAMARRERTPEQLEFADLEHDDDCNCLGSHIIECACFYLERFRGWAN